MSKADEIGRMYAKHIMELDDDVKTFKGGSWNSFFKGFKKGFHKVAPIASTVATMTGNPEISLAIDAGDMAMNGSGKKQKKRGSLLMEYLKNKKSVKGGTTAQDEERKRLDLIAQKYTGKKLDEIDEKAVMGQKEEKEPETKKKKPRRIVPTLISEPVVEEKKSFITKRSKARKKRIMESKHHSKQPQTKPRRKNRNVIPCDNGYEIRKKKKKITNPNDKRKRRGALMKKLMKERKISFIEASKAIKSEGLTY